MKKIIYLFLGGLIFTGCQPNYYIPHTQNVTLFDKANQAQVSGSFNSGGYELQAGYSVSNHAAVSLSGGIFSPDDIDNGDGGSGYYVEPAFGYFNPLGDNMIFETYAVAGFGNVENHFPSTLNDHPNTTGKISANLMTYGLQPQIGYKSKNFSAAFSSRFVIVNYSNISGSLMYDNQSQVKYLTTNANNFMIEPALTLRGGSENLKLQVQLGNSFNLSNSDFKQKKGFISLGIVGQF